MYSNNQAYCSAGAVGVTGTGVFTIDTGTFNNNLAKYNGGTLFSDNSQSAATIMRSNFEFNIAYFNGESVFIFSCENHRDYNTIFSFLEIVLVIYNDNL